MDANRWMVTLVGIVLIVLVNLWFFASRRSP
jgi:plastocyanin domain-containing protein